MYESRFKPLISRRAFVHRVARSVADALALIAVALAIGTVGYHKLADLPWIDSFENASMILTGMGPVSPMPSDGAKLFASFYALFSGIAFLGMVTLMLAPIVHRFLHRLHIEDESS